MSYPDIDGNKIGYGGFTMLNQIAAAKAVLGIELIIFSDILSKLKGNGETDDAVKLVDMMSGYIIGSVDAKEYFDFLETLKGKLA